VRRGFHCCYHRTSQRAQLAQAAPRRLADAKQRDDGFEMSFAPGDIPMPNSRALPAGHEVLWRATEAGTLRGGIGQSGVPV
jgi:hypothetical protein